MGTKREIKGIFEDIEHYRASGKVVAIAVCLMDSDGDCHTDRAWLSTEKGSRIGLLSLMSMMVSALQYEPPPTPKQAIDALLKLDPDALAALVRDRLPALATLQRGAAE
jgi:hypothetical protein